MHMYVAASPASNTLQASVPEQGDIPVWHVGNAEHAVQDLLLKWDRCWFARGLLRSTSACSTGCVCCHAATQWRMCGWLPERVGSPESRALAAPAQGSNSASLRHNHLVSASSSAHGAGHDGPQARCAAAMHAVLAQSQGAAAWSAMCVNGQACVRRACMHAEPLIMMQAI